MATLTLNRFLLHIRSVESRSGSFSDENDSYDQIPHEGSHDTGGDTLAGPDHTELTLRPTSAGESMLQNVP